MNGYDFLVAQMLLSIVPFHPRQESFLRTLESHQMVDCSEELLFELLELDAATIIATAAVLDSFQSLY